MATTSEIQVTEAYIGLLGRAPDPAGLAYWAAELDEAIAAGEDPAVALKKLTNDITLSDEWDSGIGANDASTEAGSEAIVTAMYNNLFDRAATQTELDYWAPKLVSEEFTASEMAVALIEGAGTTDGDVLGYKQQAATYYVETVGDNHNNTSAAASVADVNGPISLADSKTNTDYVATGVGSTIALTAANDTAAMTAGSDTVTGTSGTDATFGTNDNITDTSSVDSDTLTITGDDDFTFGTVVKVENINVEIGKQVGGGFTVDADKAVGGTIDFTVQDTVAIAGVDVTGETVLTVNNLASNLTTHNVSNLTVDLDDDAITITTDADATTVSVGAIDDGATSIVLGNDSAVSLGLEGTAATNDSASVSGTGTVTLDVDGGGVLDVEYLTLSGGSNDVNFDMSGANDGDDMRYTTEGDYTVTLTGAAADFDNATFSMGATTALDVDTAGDLTLTGQGVFAGGIDLSYGSGNDSVTLQSGNTVSITADQNATDETIFVEANDTTAGTLTLDISNDTGELTTTNFETVTIDTNTGNHTIDEIDMDDNDASVTIVGTGDLVFTGGVDTGSLSITQNDVTGVAIDAGKGTLDITANADDITATGTISAQNDITLTAEDAVVVVAVTGSNGDVTISGDDVTATGTITATAGTVDIDSTNDAAVVAVTSSAGDIEIDTEGLAATGTISAANDITITASDDVDVVAVTNSAAGAISISGTEIDTTGVVGHATNTTSVTLSASNDALTSTIGANMNAASSITLSDGKFDASGFELSTESLVISGDVTLVGGNVQAESITITSTNDVTIDAFDEKVGGEGGVLSAGSATGDITATITGDSTGTMTVVTGSGDDTLTLNEGAVINVQSGAGDDDITVTELSANSVINAEGGDDTIDADETAVAYTIAGGAGNDTFNVADESHASIDGGEGDGDIVNLAAGFEEVNFSMTNIEKVDLAGAAELSIAQFANESSFELSGAGQVLTINASAATTAQTISLAEVTGNIGDLPSTIVQGGTKDDTITGSEMVDVIHGNAGNDTMTGGGSRDDFTIDVTDAGSDTITDFTTATDKLDIDGYTNSAGNVSVVGVAQSAGAVTLDSTKGVNEFTGGTNNSTITDFSNGTQVLAAVSNGTVNCTNGDDLLLIVYQGTKAYIYLAVEADADALINADEITLIATLDDIAAGGVDDGDFI